jgi:hypothetical protein
MSEVSGFGSVGLGPIPADTGYFAADPHATVATTYAASNERRISGANVWMDPDRGVMACLHLTDHAR